MNGKNLFTFFFFFSYALGDHTFFDEATPDVLIGGLSAARFFGICEFINEAIWKLQRWSMKAWEAVKAHQVVSDVNKVIRNSSNEF